MTLDEAIKHCEEKAKELKTEAEERPYRTNGFSQAIPMSDTEVADCLKCAEEHEQLAEWLKELKALKEAPKGDLISREALEKHAIWTKVNNGAELIDIEVVPLVAIDNAPRVITNAVYEAMCTITDQEFEYSDDFWIITPKGKKIYFEKKRPEGKWVKIGDIGLAYTCNKCGEVNVIPTNFCPNCGVRMQDVEGREK